MRAGQPGDRRPGAADDQLRGAARQDEARFGLTERALEPALVLAGVRAPVEVGAR
jgi:hypothetical protein